MPVRKKTRRWRLKPGGEGTISPPRPRPKPQSARLKPEEQMLAALTVAGYPPPAAQHRFHPKRRWQFDFAWPVLKLALEVEGGIFVRGRHVSPSGFIADCEKYGEATVMGWSVLRIPVAGKDWLEKGVSLVVRFIEARIA